ncbi:MAG: M3 family metallopeptidase [Gammaproteobacteria bacterium]|nr:M3 family metallopeptidase [Gammaproteobacteria bacterium]
MQHLYGRFRYSPTGAILNNPLTAAAGLPAFSAIRSEHVRPAVVQVLEQQRQRLKVLERQETPSFDWALQLERINAAVHRLWGPVAHLNAVLSSPEFRDAYNSCLSLITEFGIELGQNRTLHRRFSQLEKLVDHGDRTKVQLISHALRDFRLAGVALDDRARNRFAEIAQNLAQLQASFEQNLMDATDAFQHHETAEEIVAGLPEVVLERARRAAESKDLPGWLLSLDPPTYVAVMTHAESETLRKRFYEAWVTRASDRGPQARRWDNGSLIEDILRLRHEAAELLEFENYAELSLATKMASTPMEVFEFLTDLAAKSRPVAKKELRELTEFAGRSLNAWDVDFYAERLKQVRFQLADDELRPYFPLPRVLEGMFRVAETLFGIRISAREGVDSWHPDVRYFEIRSTQDELLGSFFVDLFARPNKRGGAWMDGCLVRARLTGLNQQPVAYLVCNFSPPGEGQPSLLTHNDVVTLFHEFGHALHHLLTEVDFPSLAGINGVPWDAVELPSQFFENYAWLPEVLPWISSHYRTGEMLPVDKLAALNASRTFHAGLSMVRQLELALFDFRLHVEYDPAAGARVAETLAQVRSEVAVIDTPAFNRFACTFSHVFGGGYAAGYYSYKWAEVLAADAFSAFEEHGTFDADTAEEFRRSILASGGSRDTMNAFIEFRGRAPSLAPLLRQAGIQPEGTDVA